MRLWAEERRVGTIELPLTSKPIVTAWQATLGKFLASWIFSRPRSRAYVSSRGITADHLGSPDNGVILCGVSLAASLMAGIAPVNQLYDFRDDA